MTEVPEDERGRMAPLAARQWRYVGPSGDVRDELASLGSLLEVAGRSACVKAPAPASGVMSDIGREQLIVIAEAVRSMATSPLIELGLLDVLVRVLERVVRGHAETAAPSELSAAAEAACRSARAVIDAVWTDR